MKEKIMNIKNILRIIISLFVIFSMIKSCAKAVDFTTLTDYVNQTANFYNGNNYYQIIKQRINQPSMQSVLAQYSSNYEAMLVYCIGANSDMYVWLYTNPSGSLSDYGNSTIYIHGNGMILKMDKYMNPPTIYLRPTNNITQHITECYRTEANKFNELYGMNYSTYTYGNQILTYVGNGGYSPIKQLEFENAIEDTGYNGNLFTYYYKGDFYSNNEIFLGDIIPNDSYYFEIRLKDSKTGIIKGTSYVALNTTPYIFYNDSAIYINEDFEVYAIPRLLNYSTQYQLEITSYYGEGGNDLKEDIDWFIFLPQNATISGDVITSLGSGDFTNQNATNQIIDNQNKNQSWLEQTYNNLFVMESGDVEDLVENMKANLKISNIGDLSGEKAILETLTGDPSDFIIAWNSTQYMGKTIIPSGEINFSQKVREVPALQTTQNWLRIIMGYSISVVLLSEIFFTILKVLGVSVSIYDQHNEEIERLEEMHTPKVYDTEVITPKGVKRYRTRRTRIQ